MEKLYYRDTYLKECECTALSVIKSENEIKVITDKTVFYPECGGQPGDTGFLGQFQVLDTQKSDEGDSVLIFDKNSQIEEGVSYTLKLDWNHRYRFMKLHTAQHMLSGLLFTMFNIGTVSVHLGEDFVTIETDKASIEQQTVEKLVDTANQKISESHRIVYHEMSHRDAELLGLRRSIKVDGDVRIVEIEGVDRIACGGVHVANTSEISLISYAGSEQIRGNVRLFFRAGEEALKSVKKNDKLITEIKKSFSCGEEEILSRINSISTEVLQLKRTISIYSKKLASLDIKANCKNYKCVVMADQDTDLSSYVQASNDFENLALCAVVPGQKNIWLIILKGRFASVNFNELRSSLLTPISAKGGGKAPVYQGVCPGGEQSAKKLLDGFNALVC